MQPSIPAKLLWIHISEGDRFQGKPLYEAIVDRCREMNIAGATVFRGLEGFGESAEMHQAYWTRHDQPIVITIADTAEHVRSLMPVIEHMMDTGVLSVSDVSVIRVQRDTDSTK
jgi:PII-like signaling protein